jgi:hypothetical protein
VGRFAYWKKYPAAGVIAHHRTLDLSAADKQATQQRKTL